MPVQSPAHPALQSERLYQDALSLMHRSLPQQAVPRLQEALALEPDNPVYLSTLGLCLAQSGVASRQAIEYCKRAVHLQPREVELRVNLGRVFRLHGDRAAAHRTFLTAWRMDPRHPTAASELAGMGVRRVPPIPFLPRSHWCNRNLGRLRWQLRRLWTQGTSRWSAA